MERHGWRLLFYTEFGRQRSKLKDAAERAQRKDPLEFASNANVKLLRAVDRAMSDVIPQDPSRAEYRQGNTLGSSNSRWRGPSLRVAGRSRWARGGVSDRASVTLAVSRCVDFAATSPL